MATERTAAERTAAERTAAERTAAERAATRTATERTATGGAATEGTSTERSSTRTASERSSTRTASERSATGGAALRQHVTDAITQATFAELAESGYARMSMEAVARRAGVGKAALYRRWPSKEEMLTELIRQAVEDTLPPPPSTGALRTDLRELLGAIRAQLGNPIVSSIGPGLLAEARHASALADVLYTSVAAPRRAAARTMLQAAIGRGELPAQLDLELAADFLIAPLAFRMLIMNGTSDDNYLDTLTTALEAALKAAAR
jgi:AcrR family transcriptional regulator